MRAPLRTVLMALVALLFAMPAGASMILPVGLNRMTGTADTIVAGVVRESHAYWENDRIYTDLTIETMEFIKHDSAERPAEIVVTTMGGSVGDTRMEVGGGPVLDVDQEVVLFLVHRSGKRFIFGLNYGLCHVYIDPATEQQMVSGPVFEGRILRDAGTQALTLNALPPNGEEIQAFFNRIRSEIAPGRIP